MKAFRQNPVVRFFSSLKLSLVLLAIIAVACAAATFIESRVGTTGAQALVYNARWFEILLGLLVFNLTLALLKWIPFRAKQIGFVTVHVAIIVILISAFITRFFGYEGLMPIREGESTDFIFSDLDHVQLSMDGQRVSFPVRLYKPGPQGISRKVKLNNETYHLAINEYWPRYEERWVAGEGGTPAFRFVLDAQGHRERRTLLADTVQRVGGFQLRYLAGDFAEYDIATRSGQLLIHIAGGTHRLAVPEQLPAEATFGGYRFAITEYHPDFKVGEEPDLSRPPNNPMIRVEIEDPEGQRGEKVLFAFHPEFSMGHAGQDEAFADLDLVYHFGQSLEFIAEGETGLTGRASLPLLVKDPERAAVLREISPGEEFPVQLQVLYEVPAAELSILSEEILASAVRRPMLSDDPDMPPAARLTVTDASGHSAETVVIRGMPAGGAVDVGGKEASLALGPVEFPLPYRLHLEDFVLLTYPGSNNPASYESHVRLYDPEKGIDGLPVRIYMNHPLAHRGSKHFQSSYDPDRRGTVLSVNHDPGKWPTYVGYSLIVLGFFLVLIKNLIWPRDRVFTRSAS